MEGYGPEMFQNQQKSLITNYNVNSDEFVPSDNDWQQHCISISGLISQVSGDEKALIRFVFEGAGENITSFTNIEDPCNGEYQIIEEIGGNWLYTLRGDQFL